MFYWLSKTLDIVISPVFLSLVLAFLAFLFARRSRSRQAWRCGGASVALLYLFSTPLVAGPLFEYVERFDATLFREDQTYDAVLVLGGFTGHEVDGRLALSEGADRLLRGYELLRSNQARFGIIAAGGFGSPVEADLAAQLLQQWGVPGERLLLGRRSVNTRQNAQEIAQIVGEHGFKRLVLVTSAFHMERALECLRAVGLEADALPCDFQAPEAGRLFDLLAPRAFHLARSEQALRELLGRVVYRALGYAKARET